MRLFLRVCVLGQGLFALPKPRLEFGTLAWVIRP